MQQPSSGTPAPASASGQASGNGYHPSRVTTPLVLMQLSTRPMGIVELAQAIGISPGDAREMGNLYDLLKALVSAGQVHRTQDATYLAQPFTVVRLAPEDRELFERIATTVDRLEVADIDETEF